MGNIKRKETVIKNVYYTGRLNLAAWLIYSGFEIYQVDISPDNKTLFIFKASDELICKKDEYFSGNTTSVNLLEFDTCTEKIRKMAKGIRKKYAEDKLQDLKFDKSS